MKKLFCRLVIFLMTFFISNDTSALINMCQFDSVEPHRYEEVASKTIVWEELFDVALSNYFVYLYSPYCGHCLSIQNLVVQYAFCGEKEIRFVVASEDVRLGQNIELTMGASTVEQVWILGYPSLLTISQRRLVANIAGTANIVDILTR